MEDDMEALLEHEIVSGRTTPSMPLNARSTIICIPDALVNKYCIACSMASECICATAFAKKGMVHVTFSIVLGSTHKLQLCVHDRPSATAYRF